MSARASHPPTATHSGRICVVWLINIVAPLSAPIGGYFSAAAARLITRRDKRNREVRILPAG